MSLSGSDLRALLRARSMGDEPPLLDVNGGVEAPVLIPTVVSVPQGYQNVDMPDYRLNKGTETYVSEHEKQLKKNPPWQFVPFYETDVERARGLVEFQQNCQNLYNQHIKKMARPINPRWYPESFRTFDFRDEILRNVHYNQVSLILGKTGCGKSTQIPQYILRDCASRDKPCRIFVTQPRRVAARQAATFVAQSTGWELGDVVGYQIGGEKDMVTDYTLLRYVTPGVLLRQVIGRRTQQSKQMTHLIIDEIHERTAEMDMLLILARRIMVKDPELRIVLMSATFDENLFRNYFLSQHFHHPDHHHRTSIPSVRIETEEYPVQEYWLEHYVKDVEPVFQRFKEKYANRVDFEEVSLSYPALVPWVMDIALEIINMHSLDNERERNLSDEERERKSILVFLPGYGEILEMEERIIELDPIRNKWEVVLLHSRLRGSGEQRIFARARKGHRKIILSTNLAESSITIEDVRYIIDFGLTKRNVVDKDTNLSYLRLEWCSQAEIRQRTGRAGRVQRGKVYHMIPLEFYNSLPTDPPPEITRGSLTRLVLAAKMAKVKGETRGKFLTPKEMFAEALSPPNEEDVDRAILSLKELHGLTLSADGRVESQVDRYDGVVTNMGELMNSLPIDLHLSRLVAFGCVFGIPKEAIAVAALLTFENVFLPIFKGDLKQYHTMLYWSNGSFSDPIALFRIYETFKSKPDRKRFCHEVGVDYKVIMEVTEKENEIKEILERDGWCNLTLTSEDMNLQDRMLFLKIAIFAAFYPNYFLSDVKSETEIIHEAGGPSNPLNSVYLKKLPMGDHPKSKVYADQIRKQLELVSDDFSLDFRDSKCFVTFGPNLRPEPGAFKFPEEEKRFQKVSLINTSVYLALKAWSTRRNAFRIRVFKHNEVDGPAPKRIKLEDDDDSPLMSIPEKNLDRLRRQLVKEERDEFPIQVLAVDDPGFFWARCLDDLKIGELRKRLNHPAMLGTMKVLKRKHFRHGTPVLALSRAESWGQDNEYSRGVILNIKIKDGKKYAMVRFVDSAAVALCPVEGLRAYSKKVSKLLPGDLQQRLAFPCALAHVAPYHLADNDFAFSAEAIELLRTLVKQGINRVMAKIYSVEYGVAKVFLGFGQGAAAEVTLPGFLHNYMQDKELACIVPESSESREDNDTFRRLRIGAADANKIEPREGELQPNNEVELSDLTVDEEEEGTEVRELGGPFSALKLTFHAMAYKEKEREVMVGSESVNCVPLDPSCGRGARQLLVAGRVALDASQMRLHARCTTAFSWKPGTQLLLTLLFAPSVEFRVDESGSRIVGVLCGLGFTRDERRKPVAVYPDHDMEIDADIEVSPDDIYAANRIRVLFNKLLVQSSFSSEEYIKRSKLQRILQGFVKEYLECPRLNFNAWKGSEPRRTYHRNHWDELSRAGINAARFWARMADENVLPTFCDILGPQLRLSDDPRQLAVKLAQDLRHCAFLRMRIKHQGKLQKQHATCLLCGPRGTEMESGMVGLHINTPEHKLREAEIQMRFLDLPLEVRMVFQSYWDELDDIFKQDRADYLEQWDNLVKFSAQT